MTDLKSLLNRMKVSRDVSEVKSIYKRLAFTFHPDRTGTDTNEIMQEINALFHDCLQGLSGRVYTRDGGKAWTYTYNKDKEDYFINVLKELIKIDGITVEICGFWLWLHGSTYENKEKIKQIAKDNSMTSGFSRNKKLWYLHPGKYKRYSKEGSWTLDKIRRSYGSQYYNPDNDSNVKAS